MSDIEDNVKRLGRLDVCAVSDAMDKIKLPSAISGLEQRSTTRRIAGRVVTYRLVPASEAPTHHNPPRHLGTTAIEMACDNCSGVSPSSLAPAIAVLRQQKLEISNP